MLQGKDVRLGRLFADGGPAVVVAIDHGQTFGPMDGLLEYTAAAEKLKEADGVLLAPQMVRFSGGLFQGKGSPVMITRLNWNSIHCEPWHYREARVAEVMPVEQAVAMGTEVVLASLVLQTGSEEHDAYNVSVFARCVEQTYRLGVPIIGEVFGVGGMREQPDEFHDYIMRVTHIACELGADAIKTFYTGPRFAEVTAGVPIPVFALGAEKFEHELDALELARKAISAGARGVVFGRNVVQAVSPTSFLRGLKDVVQGRSTPAEAAAHYGLR
jgi:fructose-bisphosphate aldolase, class I